MHSCLCYTSSVLYYYIVVATTRSSLLSLTGLVLQNIHNTIHVLLPGNGSTADRKGATSEASATPTRAVLVNPRIGVGSNTPDDAGENSSTLDKWYGDTSPMTNVRAGVDTLLCRTFASDVENGPNVLRLGGPVTVQRKTLVTNPSRTSIAAKDALVKQLEDHGHLRFMAVDKIELYVQRDLFPCEILNWSKLATSMPMRTCTVVLLV